MFKDLGLKQKYQFLNPMEIGQCMEDRERQVIEGLLKATQHGTSINNLGEAIRATEDLFTEPETLEMKPSQRKDL